MAPARPERVGLLLPLVLVLVGLVAAAIGVVGLTAPRALGLGSSEEAEREAITQRVTDFAITNNTYDVADPDDYLKRMKGLLTDDFDEQFEKVTTAVFEALGDRKQKSDDAKVLGVGVSGITTAKATALVAVDASLTTDGQAAVERRMRWKVQMVKSDGEWLVDNFQQVTSVDASAEGDTPTPSTPPSSAAPSTTQPSPSTGSGE